MRTVRTESKEGQQQKGQCQSLWCREEEPLRGGKKESVRGKEPLRTEALEPSRSRPRPMRLRTADITVAGGPQVAGALQANGTLMTPHGIDPVLAALSEQTLVSMAEAGNTAVECMANLHRKGRNLVAEVLRGHGQFTEWEHYPTGDVNDCASHAQYYFHAHPPESRDDPDYGHFHTFLRSGGIPSGVTPAPVPDLALPANQPDHVCHLIAISVTREGFPERLFTTNRWVTGDIWYSATDVIAMLDRFVIKSGSPSRPLNRWLSAMFVLFRPQIEQLLIVRDRAVDVWQMMHPEQNVFEDRRLEITSSVDISLQAQLAALDRALDNRSDPERHLAAS